LWTLFKVKETNRIKRKEKKRRLAVTQCQCPFFLCGKTASAQTVRFHQKNKKNSFIKTDYKPKNRATSIKQNSQKNTQRKNQLNSEKKCLHKKLITKN